MRPRRQFLGGALSFAAAAALGAAAQVAPAGQSSPNPNSPFGPVVPGGPPDKMPPRDPRRILKENQEEIRKDVARLADLVADLQKQLADSDTKDVLPLDVVRKMDEIDKLARQIKSLVVA